MTQIYFYSGAADKLDTSCRLCAKAMQQGLNVLIYTLDTTLIEQLDRLLWTFSSTSFIPHCRVDDELVGVTPVVLGDRIEKIMHNDILLNLHEECPPSFERFKRLIEIAGISPNDKLAARKRFRFYQKEGYDIQHYKLTNKSS